MRTITRELYLPVAVEAAFALLHTPSAIRAWWAAARAVVAARRGGLWVAAWGADEDAPDYITAARILIWEPPHRLRLGEFEYVTPDGQGLPFEAALETEFTVLAEPEGCRLTVRQSGFPAGPAADAFFTACEQGWAATFAGIARYVKEHGPAGAGQS
jgi:uncharacterized protein YndB with AHSA1/START domain